MRSEEWAGYRGTADGPPQKVDGHFVFARWDGAGIAFFSDELGLRTLYYAPAKNGVWFSTRLEWVCAASGLREIDFHVLGPRWLLFNQLSFASGIKGIGRVGPGGYLRVHRGAVADVGTGRWTPAFEGGTTAQTVSVAESLAACAFSAGRAVSVGLSGGLDSRLLLALLLRRAAGEVRTHSFGSEKDPDVFLAGRIARALRLQHTILHEPVPASDACLSLARSYAAHTHLTEPVSSCLKLRYYPRLREEGVVVVDGAFGEFARRQYLNRILFRGRAALVGHDARALLPLMRVDRGCLFTPDVQRMLSEGALAELDQVLAGLPDADVVEPENLLDLLTVRTRIPNYAGPDQARLDGEVMNYMPLAQPSFLRAALACPVKSRRKAEVHRDTLRRWHPLLTRFPLAKSGTTYPFSLSHLGAYAVVEAKRRLGLTYRDHTVDLFLRAMKEYALDSASSSRIKDSSLYDGRRVRETVEAYYGGARVHGYEVNWYLTLELWRESLGCS
jgi:hypothetical protein